MGEVVGLEGGCGAGGGSGRVGGAVRVSGREVAPGRFTCLLTSISVGGRSGSTIIGVWGGGRGRGEVGVGWPCGPGRAAEGPAARRLCVIAVPRLPPSKAPMQPHDGVGGVGVMGEGRGGRGEGGVGVGGEGWVRGRRACGAIPLYGCHVTAGLTTRLGTINGGCGKSGTTVDKAQRWRGRADGVGVGVPGPGGNGGVARSSCTGATSPLPPPRGLTCPEA